MIEGLGADWLMNLVSGDTCLSLTRCLLLSFFILPGHSSLKLPLPLPQWGWAPLILRTDEVLAGRPTDENPPYFPPA